MSEEITNRWSDDYSGRWVNRCYLIVPVADINSADAPTDSNTKAQIKTWMDSYGYDYTSDMSKSELLGAIPVSNALIGNAIQSGKDTLRKNNGDDGDSSKALLKFACDNDPDNDSSVFSSYTKLSHSQIMSELSSSEWTTEIE
tara:strand:- start:83 stop:511 length:429 start_codon:yes stop_codon:yes gene_type:complete